MDCLSIRYEGVILRDPNTMYKHGRSTAKEGGLIKEKRLNDWVFIFPVCSCTLRNVFGT